MHLQKKRKKTLVVTSLIVALCAVLFLWQKSTLNTKVVSFDRIALQNSVKFSMPLIAVASRLSQKATSPQQQILGTWYDGIDGDGSMTFYANGNVLIRVNRFDMTTWNHYRFTDAKHLLLESTAARPHAFTQKCTVAFGPQETMTLRLGSRDYDTHYTRANPGLVSTETGTISYKLKRVWRVVTGQ